MKYVFNKLSMLKFLEIFYTTPYFRSRNGNRKPSVDHNEDIRCLTYWNENSRTYYAIDGAMEGEFWQQNIPYDSVAP